MNTPSVLFIDVYSLKMLKARLPELDVYSENVKSLDFISSSLSTCVTFDISCRAYIPLPPMQFTRHHLKLSVKEASLQPLMLESGFLSFGSCLLAERNPANEHLPSFSLLQRRSLPGLRLPWWPWKPHSWRHVPGSRRSKRPPRFFNAAAHLLSSFNNPNWYHWLGLPGLGSLPINKNIESIIISDRNLFMNNNTPTPLLQRVATLAKAVQPHSKLLFEGGPFFIKELHACFIEHHTPLACDASGLQHLRLASASIATSACKISTTNKLYLRRGPLARRPLHGEEYLERALLQRGFDVLDAAALQLPECIATFAKADWVVAPHGAALTNIVFSRPGTKVVELLPGPLENYGHYSLMASALGLMHSYLIGRNLHEDEFEVDQNLLLVWLDAELLAAMK